MADPRVAARPARLVAAVGAVVLVGFALRLHGIGTRGLWWDAIDMWLHALGAEPSAHAAPLSPWLYGNAMAAVSSASSFTFHLISVVLGSAAIAVSFVFGRRVGGTTVGLIAAALVALCPLLIDQGQDGRPYALLQLTTVLLLDAHLRASEAPRPRRWAWLGACVVACCMTHLLALQLLFGLAAHASIVALSRWRAGDRAQRRQVLARLATFAIVVGVAAALGLSWSWWRPLGLVLQGAYPAGAASYARNVLIGLGPGFLWPLFDLGREAPGGLDLAALLFFALFAYGALGGRATWAARSLGLCVVLLPLLATYLTLGPKADWAWLRYVAHLSIPYLALVALALATIARRWPLTRALLALAVLLAFTAGLAQWWRWATHDREARFARWAREIGRLAPPPAGVIFPEVEHGYGDEARRAIAYYARHRATQLPSYHLGHGRIRRVTSRAGRAGLARLPVLGDDVASLPAGRYAFYSRFFGGRAALCDVAPTGSATRVGPAELARCLAFTGKGSFPLLPEMNPRRAIGRTNATRGAR